MTRSRSPGPTPRREAHERDAAPKPRGREMPPPLHDSNLGSASQPVEPGRNSGRGSEETRLAED